LLIVGVANPALATAQNIPQQRRAAGFRLMNEDKQGVNKW